MTVPRDSSSPRDIPVSVALLVQRRITLEWHEAIAIVVEIAEVLERSDKKVLPTYQDLVLTPEGSVRFVREPSQAGNPVAALADICRALLPEESPTQVWTIVSAATEPSSYKSVTDLAAALKDFERPGRPRIVSAVYRRGRNAPVRTESSRVRRARTPRSQPDVATPTIEMLHTQPANSSSSEATSTLAPALGEIADSLSVAKSCWDLSAEGQGRPYDRTLSEVTRIELQRATWLVKGLQVLAERPTLHKTTRNLGTLLDRVFQATQSERRLANVKLSANLTEASITLAANKRLLLIAFGGMLQAVLALVREITPAEIRCHVVSRDSIATVEFSQVRVSTPDPLLARFFDETYHGRPAGTGQPLHWLSRNVWSSCMRARQP